MSQISLCMIVKNEEDTLPRCLDSVQEWIDEIIVDKPLSNPLHDLAKLRNKFSKGNFDCVITIYSTTRVGLAAFLARIKYRLAPATKVAQIFYNHSLKQRRSRSEKPEFVYNLDLVNKFLIDHGVTDQFPLKPPFIKFDLSATTQLHTNFREKYHINPQHKLIFLLYREIAYNWHATIS